LVARWANLKNSSSNSLVARWANLKNSSSNSLVASPQPSQYNDCTIL